MGQQVEKKSLWVGDFGLVNQKELVYTWNVYSQLLYNRTQFSRLSYDVM